MSIFGSIKFVDLKQHNMQNITYNLSDIKERLHNSKAVTVLTGAGISAESGVPTFRGNNGLWKNFRPEEIIWPPAAADWSLLAPGFIFLGRKTWI